MSTTLIVPTGRMIDSYICRLLCTDQENELTNLELLSVLTISQKVLCRDQSLMYLEVPINVCGDVHADMEALVHLFCLGRWPPIRKFLFLGDYVDRGASGVEVFTMLLLLKIRFPNHIFLTRGNHETASMNKKYGFADECVNRYSQKMWQEFLAVFDMLPLAAVVHRRIFCVHGGISNHLKCLEQLRRIRRPVKITRSGVLNDIVWSDPINTFANWKPSGRSCTNLYGPSAVEKFCARCNIHLIVRSHQMVDKGYEFNINQRVLTVFGIPLYGRANNMSAMVYFNEKGTGRIKQLCVADSVPPPTTDPAVVLSRYFSFEDDANEEESLPHVAPKQSTNKQIATMVPRNTKPLEDEEEDSNEDADEDGEDVEKEDDDHDEDDEEDNSEGNEVVKETDDEGDEENEEISENDSEKNEPKAKQSALKIAKTRTQPSGRRENKLTTSKGKMSKNQ